MRELMKAAAVGMCLSLSTVSFAEAGDAEAAARLFNEGRSAMKGEDFTLAYEKLSRSQQLDPSAGTLLNLAICEERLGKLVEAYGHIQEVLAQLPADDPRLPVAKEQAASIDRRVPRLTLQLSATAPAGTGVRLDGNPVSGDALGAPIPMNPGRHVVVVGAPGHQPREWIVELAEGERKELALSPAQDAGPQSSARADESHDNTTAYILLGVGAAGVAAAGVTGMMLRGKQATVDDHCDEAKRCDPEGLDAADAGKRLVPIYTGAWIVGAAGLATGAYLLFSADDEPERGSSVNAVVLPSGGAVTWRGRF